MKLRHLIKNIPDIVVKGAKDLEITGVTEHSQCVLPQNIFVAKPGGSQHGSVFIPEAKASGATCVVTDMYDPSLKGMTQIITHDVAHTESLLAAKYYDNPSHALFMVGVTGTNGKTTTSYILKHLLEKLIPASVGLIGTIEYLVGRQYYMARHTTPDICTNQKLLRSMINNDCKACVMEVSSHALAQKRTDGLAFDVTIFTNLTHEHLDYHKTIEKYAAVKKTLFDSLETSYKKPAYEKTLCINQDSPWAEYMMQDTKCRILSYGIEKGDVRAENIELHPDKTTFVLTSFGQKEKISLPFCGRFFVYNVLGAIAACLARGFSLHAITEALSDVQGVAGRLERVANTLGVHVFVDYAHTDDALLNVLTTLKECSQGRIITVFGCGGDRDYEKRPKMAKVAEAFSDMCIVTMDNPRSEDPEKICQEITSGFSNKENHTVLLDRKQAIFRAIALANEKDIVLIAGKGHETQQMFAHRSIDFDDREVAKWCCEEIARGEKVCC